MEENTIPQEFSRFYLKDVTFMNLMLRRIYNVLIVANPYDAFMLEDDGRIEEKIYNEYMELGLRYPPTFTQVSTTEEAYKVLHTMNIDLVICMPGNADNDAFSVARDIKAVFPDIHCVVLTPFSHGITRRMQDEDLSIFDYVFCWLGNTNLILSIIKLIEDKMNLDHDIREGGVQMILLVEDGIAITVPSCLISTTMCSCRVSVFPPRLSTAMPPLCACGDVRRWCSRGHMRRLWSCTTAIRPMSLV